MAIQHTTQSFGHPPAVLHSHNAKEYLSAAVLEATWATGTVNHSTIPYNPEENGILKRHNRTIMNAVRYVSRNPSYWMRNGPMQTGMWYKNNLYWYIAPRAPVLTHNGMEVTSNYPLSPYFANWDIYRTQRNWQNEWQRETEKIYGNYGPYQCNCSDPKWEQPPHSYWRLSTATPSDRFETHPEAKFPSFAQILQAIPTHITPDTPAPPTHSDAKHYPYGADWTKAYDIAMENCRLKKKYYR